MRTGRELVAKSERIRRMDDRQLIKERLVAVLCCW